MTEALPVILSRPLEASHQGLACLVAALLNRHPKTFFFLSQIQTTNTMVSEQLSDLKGVGAADSLT